MNNQQAYNAWSESYDTMRNRTRDLEAKALRESLPAVPFHEVLELGCGTGKNTEWLLTKAALVIAVDFSEEMLAKAKEKVRANKVQFRQADLREEWGFTEREFDLITCSLALEHIENIGFIFAQAFRVLKPGGHFYFGELHPFKQYLGSKARFETEGGTFVLECFVHHVSDYFRAAKAQGFACVELKEWFDEEEPDSPPRLLTMVFRK